MRSIVLVLMFAGSLSAHGQSSAALALKETIPLPGVSGKFDHFAVDVAGRRLFAAATGNHSVEVVDLKTNKVAQTIGGLGKPHGLAWVAATGSLYVADGVLGELRAYQGTPLALSGTLKLSDDADDMVYDPAGGLLYVGHGGSNAANPASVAVVDAAGFRLVESLSVAAHPEALELDPQHRRVYVNVADAGEVAVIDAASHKIASHWKLHKAADNVPLAWDAGRQLLYVACRKPATLIAIDAATGKEVSTAPSADGADDLFYDSALSRVYLISGAGEVDAYQVNKDGALLPLGTTHTAPGAKTALYVPAEKLLYVGVPGTASSAAEIRVYTAQAQ